MALCLCLLNSSSAKCLWFSLCWNPGLCEISGNFSFNQDSCLMCYCYCLSSICSSKEHISWCLVHPANTNSVWMCLNLAPFPPSMGSVTWKPATLSRIVTPRKSTKVLSLNDWTKPGRRRTRHLPPKPQATSKCSSSISSSLSSFQFQEGRKDVVLEKNPLSNRLIQVVIPNQTNQMRYLLVTHCCKNYFRIFSFL